MTQEGLPAVRARRLLGLWRDGDDGAVNAVECALVAEQCEDGSFDDSLMKTTGVLNLLDDLQSGAQERHEQWPGTALTLTLSLWAHRYT
jgi:hypothetical protein